MTISDYKTLVCDNGTGFVKVGYAGENFPRSIFPSIIGRPMARRAHLFEDGMDLEDYIFGDKASNLRQQLDISYPVENGIIKDWENMERLWSYTFDEKMKIIPSEHKILLTEPPLNPTSNTDRMVEKMFETFGFHACNVSIQALLTLYAQGLMTGVVVDSGDGVTHIIPIYEGYVPQDLIRRLNVAGRHLTEYLIKLLLMRGYEFNRVADFETVRRIKEKFCYVAYDLAAERHLAEETTVLMETYTLPDNRVIKIGRERFEAPEALFNPSLIDNEQPGVGQMLYEMVQKADMDLRPMLYQHIVLSGGTTMFPGFPTRFEKEIKERIGNKKVKVKIDDPPRRKHLVFLGGSVIAECMDSCEDFWVTKAEFQEFGSYKQALEKKKQARGTSQISNG